MKNIKEAISIIEDVRKSMPESANKAFLKGAVNELNEAVNSHEALKEALIEIQKQFNKDGNMTGHLFEICENALKSCE